MSVGFCVFRWPAMGIHGDKSQQERDWVLNGKCFSNFCKDLMCATSGKN